MVRGGEGTPPRHQATPCRPAPIYTQGIFEGAVLFMKMKSATARGDRLKQLKTLASVLATSIDKCDDVRALPQLAKQYRDTVREIEEIEGTNSNGDEISEILAQRQSDGKPGAVRKNRAAVSEQ